MKSEIGQAKEEQNDNNSTIEDQIVLDEFQDLKQ
ncbi:unnamed protein product [Brassica oleracea var. botrytis]|uniref:(rape) hypothetical protein n=1 Tax=Brassica napus TaxID=3708 RepID=A0A816IGG6_BRANA|nr:unnamed protein product [Brassica napus]